MKRKGLPWFRFYANTIDNLEVSKLSDSLYRIWVGMQCLTSEHGGILPSAQVIAFRLRKSQRNIDEALEKLLAVDLLEASKDGMRPRNWDRVQYKSDNSTERVNALRERKRNVTGNVASTVAVTAPEREGDTEPDTEAETESEREEERARWPDDAISKSWPEDFKLNQKHISYAANKNISTVDTHNIFDKFRNHCRSQAKQYADWDAAFYLWLDREVEKFRKDGNDRNRIDDRL